MAVLVFFFFLLVLTVLIAPLNLPLPEEITS